MTQPKLISTASARATIHAYGRCARAAVGSTFRNRKLLRNKTRFRPAAPTYKGGAPRYKGARPNLCGRPPESSKKPPRSLLHAVSLPVCTGLFPFLSAILFRDSMPSVYQGLWSFKKPSFSPFGKVWDPIAPPAYIKTTLSLNGIYISSDIYFSFSLFVIGLLYRMKEYIPIPTRRKLIMVSAFRCAFVILTPIQSNECRLSYIFSYSMLLSPTTLINESFFSSASSQWHDIRESPFAATWKMEAFPNSNSNWIEALSSKALSRYKMSSSISFVCFR